MNDAKTVIDWNGQDLPSELVKLPPGRYRIARIEGPADEPGDGPGDGPDDRASSDRPDPSGPGDAAA